MMMYDAISDTTWQIVVVVAAPMTPRSRTIMNRTSRTMFMHEVAART